LFLIFFFFFFFQAEDGIRDKLVTGVQTCALPIYALFETYVALLPRFQDWLRKNFDEKDSILEKKAFDTLRGLLPMATLGQVAFRSEERRVGKECRARVGREQ